MASGDGTLSGKGFRLGTVVDGCGEQVVLQSSNGIFELEPVGGSRAGLIAILSAWDEWRPRLISLANSAEAGDSLDEATLTFLSPVPRPPKVICIGTNYHDHLREMGVSATPEFPYAFLRPNLCLAGHREDVPLPTWPTFVDWEAELGIVIGKGGRDLSGSAIEEAIAGYTIVNDLSARDWIENRPWVGIDWVMQKAWDKFQPTGPWFTPREFVPTPQSLAIELTVNGTLRQNSSTSQMIFDLHQIIEHLSRIMTLETGDIIATGTPAGVGFGQKPRISLQAGDEMVVTIESLGSLSTKVIGAGV